MIHKSKNTENDSNLISLGETGALSFDPILPQNPTIFILGTMPGKQSLKQQQYYANKRNSFWKIIFEMYPSVKQVIFNGQKAEKLYYKYFSEIEDITYNLVLSTSPANARFSFREKLNNWKTTIL